MPKRRKQKSRLEQSYARQRKRIQNALYRAKKHGYQFDVIVIPAIPKRITEASVRRLSKITPEYIRSKAVSKTNPVVTTSKKHKLEYENEYKIKSLTPSTGVKGSDIFSRIVISNYKAHISRFNETAYTILNNWLNQMISIYGAEDVAVMLERGAEEGHIVTYKIAYDSSKINNYISRMVDYLESMGTLERDTLIDALENDEFYMSDEF